MIEECILIVIIITIKHFEGGQAVQMARGLSDCWSNAPLCDEVSVSGIKPTTASVICAQEDPYDVSVVEMLWRNMLVRKGSLHTLSVETGLCGQGSGVVPSTMHLGSYGIVTILYFNSQ
ncbi:hypothetical protein NQZ68_004229 [Dissostichus eleginoides]|nr:hypothetical protein NQZ68_004229 [Dissostichus eleginoides]